MQDSVFVWRNPLQPLESTGKGCSIVHADFFHNVLHAHAQDFNLIQPSLWESAPGKIHAFIRSNRGRIYRSDSEDNGSTWCNAYCTELPSNNSGLDCVQMENGHLILICNPIGLNWGARTPLSVLLSDDNGATFTKVLDLVTEDNDGEFSYPAIIADQNHLYITYTWRRKKICFAELEEC